MIEKSSMEIKTISAISIILFLAGCVTTTPEMEACLKAYEKFPLEKRAHIPAMSFLIGKQASEITAVDGYKVIRVLRPNSMMTMDYRLDRINLHTDCDGTIISTTNN